MSSKQPVRMSEARLERVQLLRRQISDAALELGAMANDAADPWRRAALHDAEVRAGFAALDLQAIVDRDAALPIQILPGLTIEEV